MVSILQWNEVHILLAGAQDVSVRSSRYMSSSSARKCESEE